MGESHANDQHGLPRVLYDDVNFDDQLALIDGKPFTGRIIARYESGELEEERNYIDGLPSGLQRRWHANGQLSDKSIAIRGHGVSIHEEWYPNGQMKRRTHAKFEVRIHIQEWTYEGHVCRNEALPISDTLKRYIRTLEDELQFREWPEIETI